MSLGENIRNLRKLKGYSILKLRELTGLSKSTISDLENDKSSPTADTLQKIAVALEVSVNEFFSDERKFINTDMGINKAFAGSGMLNKKTDINVDISQAINLTANDMVNIPIVGVVRAGQPILAIENIEGYLLLPKSIASGDKDYFILRVQGDSMNLEFKEGTLLVIERTSCIESGEIGVVMINGWDATVKKVVINQNMITLIPMSSNPEHIPTMYDIERDKISIAGKVKCAMKTY